MSSVQPATVTYHQHGGTYTNHANSTINYDATTKTYNAPYCMFTGYRVTFVQHSVSLILVSFRQGGHTYHHTRAQQSRPSARLASAPVSLRLKAQLWDASPFPDFLSM